jgi:hypothetical protein
MKSSRIAFAASFASLVFAIPGNSCGPFFPEAVFVQNTSPDGPYAAYAAGQIGVPQPGYSVQDLVVAYDWLNGHGLSAVEQQQAVALDSIRNNRDYDDPSKRPGFVAWLAVRKESGVPEPPAPKPQEGTFPSNPELNGDRPVLGESYQNFTNCLDVAFATAADTFKARKAVHPNDAASLTDWIHGQDAVFANCNGSGDKMPADAPGSLPEWLKQDRVYQQAAAKFYQTDYDAAIARLKVIAGDSSSPWHLMARLVAARAMIRRATIGQITELPPAPVTAPNVPYSEERETAQRKESEKAKRAYADLVTQQEPARLAEARDALQAILADPAMRQYHADAAGLLDFVNLRLEPVAQAEVLATRLTAPDRVQTPGRFQQALIDLRYFLYPPDTNTAAEAVAKRPTPTSQIFSWMDEMRATVPRQRTIWYAGRPIDPAKLQQQQQQASADALAQWRARHEDTWLIAAISNTSPVDPAAAELIEAATKIAKNSPAWTAATYNRLRLMQNATAMRAALAAVQPDIQHSPQRSTINLFKLLNQRTAPTLADFLHDAAILPAGITFDTDIPEAPTDTPDPNGLCGVNGSQATTQLFNPDAATILNTRMSLTLLADAAEDKQLPRNLSLQIAQSTWTRAVLLNRPEIARRMTPLLTGCYPASKPWLTAYDSAKTADDRRAAGLLALMRFPSNQPLVRGGMDRGYGFAVYSEYRDNWWNASDAAQPPSSSNPSGRHATFFGTQPASPTELPDPPFLTAADRAAGEHEISALREIPCASDYFATAALDWQKQHPDDPRTPDILGFAERVVRNGCRTDATKELNHRLFVVVQTKYPKGEWAKRYKTWE